MEVRQLDDARVFEVIKDDESYRVVPGFACADIADIWVVTSDIILVKQIFDGLQEVLPEESDIYLSICRRGEDGIYYYIGDIRPTKGYELRGENPQDLFLKIFVAYCPLPKHEIQPGSGEMTRKDVGGYTNLKLPRPEETMSAILFSRKPKQS